MTDPNTSGQVVIYPGCKWIEIKPLITYLKGNTNVKM